MTGLRVTDLTVRRGECPVVDHASFSAMPGECIGLIGPNGAGKTSLLRATLGLLPASGHSSLAAMPQKDRAAQAAWLPQSRHIAWPLTVETLIGLGRIPHIPRGARLRPEDQDAVDQAIARMRLDPFRNRAATDLSGGEQARVLIARALAQNTPILLADEPTAGLDPAAQLSTLGLFRDLAQDGRTVIASLHDLGLAARYCTRLILIDRGRIVADGVPVDVLTPERLADVFHIDASLAGGVTGPRLDIRGLAEMGDRP